MRKLKSYGLLVLVLGFHFSNCQEKGERKPKVETIKDYEMVKLINEISLLKSFSTNDLMLKIYLTFNLPGSAGFNNGEVTSNVLIAVSEFDELPEQALYKINDLYAPEVSLEKSSSSQPILRITYTRDDSPQTMRFRVSLSEIEKLD